MDDDSEGTRPLSNPHRRASQRMLQPLKPQGRDTEQGSDGLKAAPQTAKSSKRRVSIGATTILKHSRKQLAPPDEIAGEGAEAVQTPTFSAVSGSARRKDWGPQNESLDGDSPSRVALHSPFPESMTPVTHGSSPPGSNDESARMFSFDGIPSDYANDTSILPSGSLDRRAIATRERLHSRESTRSALTRSPPLHPDLGHATRHRMDSSDGNGAFALHDKIPQSARSDITKITDPDAPGLQNYGEYGSEFAKTKPARSAIPSLGSLSSDFLEMQVSPRNAYSARAEEDQAGGKDSLAGDATGPSNEMLPSSRMPASAIPGARSMAGGRSPTRNTLDKSPKTSRVHPGTSTGLKLREANRNADGTANERRQSHQILLKDTDSTNAIGAESNTPLCVSADDVRGG